MMKWRAVIVLLFAMVSTNSFTQAFKFGPELGLNYIKLEENYTGNNYSSGWHTGGFAEYIITDFFSIRSGVYYTQKKKNYVFNDSYTNFFVALLGLEDSDQIDLKTYRTTSGRITQNYFEIPVLATLSYKGLSVFGGLQSAVMFRAITKEVVHENTPVFSVLNLDGLGDFGNLLPPAESTSESTSQDKGDLRNFEWGTKFGMSYQLDRMAVNLSYYLGLLNYENVKNSTKHQYFQMTLSYNFGVNSGNNNFWQSRKLK